MRSALQGAFVLFGEIRRRFLASGCRNDLILTYGGSRAPALRIVAVFTDQHPREPEFCRIGAIKTESRIFSQNRKKLLTSGEKSAKIFTTIFCCQRCLTEEKYPATSFQRAVGRCETAGISGEIHFGSRFLNGVFPRECRVRPLSRV